MKFKIILTVAVLIITTILLCACAQRIDSADERPAIVYKRFTHEVGRSQRYGLYSCELEASPHKVCNYVNGIYVGGDGSLIVYKVRTGGIFDNKVYVINDNGSSQILGEDIPIVEISEDKKTIFYTKEEDDNTLYVRKYDDLGKVEKDYTINTDVTSLIIDLNKDGSGFVFTQNLRSQQEKSHDGNNPYDFNWADICLYYNGRVDKVAEKAFISQNKQSISRDGTVLYLANVDKETETGNLYKKELDSEPVLVTNNANTVFGISDDGSLTYCLKYVNGQRALYYQLLGEEPVIVEGVGSAMMSTESNSLVYTVKKENTFLSDLYYVDSNQTSTRLADNASMLIDISEDGGSTAYFSLNEQTQGVDLYIARIDGKTEHIDENVGLSLIAIELNSWTVRMSDDGKAIAYLKNFDGDMLRGVLYVKQQGEEPCKIDEMVSIGFDFSK